MRGGKGSNWVICVGAGEHKKWRKVWAQPSEEKPMPRVEGSLSVLFYTADCKTGDWEILGLFRSLEFQ